MTISQRLEIIIVTGLSGAGKSTVINALEDIGYYCIDNLPLFLLSDLPASIIRSGQSIDRLALVADSRDSRFFSRWEPSRTDETRPNSP